MTLKPPTRDDRPIWDVWLSCYWMPALSVADELGLFDTLETHPASAEELGERQGLNAEALRALLALLASLDLLSARGGRYHLNDLSRLYLLHASPYYWGHAFGIHRASPAHVQIRTAVTSTPAAVSSAFGERPVEGWERGELTPAVAQAVTAFMHSHSLPAALGAARLPVFEGIERLLDVGGGSGCFSIAFAQHHPELRCTVMELKPVAELARGYVADAGVDDRVDTCVIDMFRTAWPAGYDAIFMSNIFHDWDADTCARLAASAYAALPPGGRMLLHEMLLADDGSGPTPAAAFSMMMLVGTQGRQYSLAELTRLLEDAGFVDPTVTEAYGYYSLVSAAKPPAR